MIFINSMSNGFIFTVQSFFIIAKLRPNLTEALLRVWVSFILRFSDRPADRLAVKVFFLSYYSSEWAEIFYAESLVK